MNGEFTEVRLGLYIVYEAIYSCAISLGKSSCLYDSGVLLKRSLWFVAERTLDTSSPDKQLYSPLFRFAKLGTPILVKAARPI